MQAVVYSEYGSSGVLRLEEVAKPVPSDDEVLVKVCAASVNAADWRMMRADPFLVRLYAGLFRPKKFPILGADIAGRVESVGRNVSQFKPGDEIFEEAAAVPLAGLTALHGLRDSGQVKTGQKVLINGASGGVGTFAVQLAKYFGVEVTAVCSTQKVALIRSLGADQVIDYTQKDFTQADNNTT